MKITKDEARILAGAIHSEKYELSALDMDKVTWAKAFAAFEDLEERLHEASKDERRNGRTSVNSYLDTVKRVIKKHQAKK